MTPILASLCNLWVLCVSVASDTPVSSTTETQRTQRLQREKRVTSLLRHRGPTLVRVEAVDCSSEFESLWTKVFLIDHAVMTHDEGLHAGNSVLCGKGNQREPADHHVLNDEVQLAKRRCRSLSFQHSEEVAVKGFISAGIAALNCRSYFFTDWTTPRTIFVFPGQPILLARRADDALSVLIDAGTLLYQCILVLRFDVASTDLNRVQLVASDPPVKNFRAACFCIKRPARRSLHQWNGKRPVVFTDLQESTPCIFRLHCYVVFDASFLCEFLRHFAISRRFAGMSDVVALWSKDVEQSCFIKLIGCLDECVDCFFRCREGFGFRCHSRLRGRDRRKNQQQQHPQSHIYRFLCSFHDLLPPSTTTAT